MGTVEILNQSESVEWYTPARYIAAVRAVFGGGVALDPASCELANETVKAERYFSIENDGLSQEWRARSVFLNPPYGKTGNKSNQQIWSDKMMREFAAGHFHEGILLVNSCTGSQWFQPLWKYPICFTDHRIRFNGADSPTKDNAFVYFGNSVESFVREFEGTIGHIPNQKP